MWLTKNLLRKMVKKYKKTLREMIKLNCFLKKSILNCYRKQPKLLLAYWIFKKNIGRISKETKTPPYEKKYCFPPINCNI